MNADADGTPARTIFLCYSPRHADEAGRLRADLSAAGYDVWWDRQIEPGHDRSFETRNAMMACRVLLLCLSREALGASRPGPYAEARDALDLFSARPPGAPTPISVRFDACDVPAFALAETHLPEAPVDLHPREHWAPGLERLHAVLERIFAAPSPEPASPEGPRRREQPSQTRPDDRAPASEITRLLAEARSGDRTAHNRLWSLVYNDLREIAHRELRGERLGHTLTTTALVNEAYLKLVKHTRITWRNRDHFYALSCEIMRRILVDHARRREALRRRVQKNQVPLNEALHMAVFPNERLTELDEALERLAARHPRLAKVIECKFFGGLTMEKTAEALGLSKRTVERDWKRARTYLYQTLTQ